MTAHKRLREKEFKKEIFKIGECVWFLRPKSKGKEKAEHRWLNGLWLGIREESGEYMVGTPEGVFKVSTVRRKGSHEVSWNWEELDMFRGSPWEPIPGRPGIEMTANIGNLKKQSQVK